MIANTALYRDGSRLQIDVKPDGLAAIREAVRSGQPGDFVSIGLHEPDEAEMARVAEIFGLHRLAFEDSLQRVFDANLSRIGVHQNDTMRRMSAWAAIFAVITVFAGIYGMNFANMPELKLSFGYPLLMFLMLVISVVLDRRFKRSGWL
jgi:Mg2+ and Co2+ transporter CorA